MSTKSAQLVKWLPRVLAIAVALFVGLFALDAFNEGKGLAQTLGDVAIHLIPAAVILAIVAIAWRYPSVGAVAFIGLAAVYAVSVRRIDWIAAIAGPLFVVGVLFLLSAVRERVSRA